MYTPYFISDLSPPNCFPINIACGSSHSICLTDDGEVYTWGSNESGQLGIGNEVQNHQPYYVKFTGL